MDIQTLFAEMPARDWDTGPDGTVRLAVVGLGGFARETALPAVAAADYCEPTVVVSGTPETRESVADEYGATGLDYSEYDGGESVDRYDAVYVATPNRLHLPHARTAASLGKHVVCEKPLEATVERAAELVEVCEDAGVTLMTAYRMQADPVARRLRAFLRAGGVGDVLKLSGNFTSPVLEYGPPDQWRLDGHLAGGGALMDVGVYPLNTARFLLDADPVAVAGTVRGDGHFADVDEHVDFHVHFPGGAVGSFSASFSGHQSSSLVVHGTEGRVSVADAYEPGRDRRVTVERDGGRVAVEGLGADDVREEFDYFAHCVLTGDRPEPDGRDGLTDVRTMAAVYEAAESGCSVGLD